MKSSSVRFEGPAWIIEAESIANTPSHVAAIWDFWKYLVQSVSPVVEKEFDGNRIRVRVILAGSAWWVEEHKRRAAIQKITSDRIVGQLADQARQREALERAAAEAEAPAEAQKPKRTRAPKARPRKKKRAA